jgi:succinyl-CoA synthetase beta subunit
MLGHRLYTKQTGREGKPVNKLIMCEKLFTRREYYFACSYFFVFFLLKNFRNIFVVALERRFGGPVIITSTQGGSNIEEIAAEHPEAIIHHPIDIITGLERKDALIIAEKLGFHNEALQEVR